MDEIWGKEEWMVLGVGKGWDWSRGVGGGEFRLGIMI